MSKLGSHERTATLTKGVRYRMCDKYLLYVYTCFKWGKLCLTEDECSQLFGGRSDFVAQLDPQWTSEFLARCQGSYQLKIERCTQPWHASLVSAPYTCRVQTGQDVYTSLDREGRVIQIENFTEEPLLTRKLSTGESGFTLFKDTLSVFADIAFRMIKVSVPSEPSLIISCNGSDYWESVSAGSFFSCRVCFKVRERDVNGLKVEAGYIFTSDGISLYNVVTSWKTDICLIFDHNCRNEIVRTLCSLVLGDCNLGTDYRLKCVLHERVQGLDLRDLVPMQLTTTLSSTVTKINESKTYPESLLVPPSCTQIQNPNFEPCDYERKSLITLRDMTILPCGFSILAENEKVVALRHLLRDVVVIVPKRGANQTMYDPKNSSSKSVVADPPLGCLMEWFPCDYSLLKVKSGISGLPPVVITCEYGQNEQELYGVKRENYCDLEAPTLHVLSNPHYHTVLPETFSSDRYLYCQSVCLLPENMEIITPMHMQVEGYIALMYAFNVYNELIGSGHADSQPPVHLSILRTLSLKEARNFLLLYLSLTDTFVFSKKSCFRFKVNCHSVLAELRKMVSLHPKVYTEITSLGDITTEEAMCHELEADILDTSGAILQLQDPNPRVARSDARDYAYDSGKDKSQVCSDHRTDELCDETCEYKHGRYTGTCGQQLRGGEYEVSAQNDKAMNCYNDTDNVHYTVRHVAAGSGPSNTIIRQNTGHAVLFGQGGGGNWRFKFVTVGMRTLGLMNLKILRASGVFHTRHGYSRAVLKIPSTSGVLAEPCWLGQPAVLTDDLCVIKAQRDVCNKLTDCTHHCSFQLNYSPYSRDNDERHLASVPPAERAVILSEMSRLERAVCSDQARGYEECRLVRLLKSAHVQQMSTFEIQLDIPPIQDSECRKPLYTRSYLVPERETERSITPVATIGDGDYFPLIEIAKEMDKGEKEPLSYPLAIYHLSLKVKQPPHNPYAMNRADRSCGECGSVYEACLDEAVLLGHCARVSAASGAKKNFDVSLCLSWFYRSVHPCVPDMHVGNIMLDYEFLLHGKGYLPPVYALLSHLTESCRVNYFPRNKLFTLSRHRGASVSTRGTDIPFIHSQRLRMNVIGAFLCSQDHRLAPLLSRCCFAEPLQPCEFEGADGVQTQLLPRGDEEQLLVQAYSRTLGTVYEFERTGLYPRKVKTSLGDWSFLRLINNSESSSSTSCVTTRHPGTAVVHGYTIAFASESPLYYLREHGPLIQRLESVAVIVEDGSLYRTDVLHTEEPEWPEPDVIDAQRIIKCRPKRAVIDEMFMRNGGRDPLESQPVESRNWYLLLHAQWSYKKAPRCQQKQDEWEHEYPVSESLTAIGKSHDSGQVTATTKWLCEAPPARFKTHECFSTDSKLSSVPVTGRIEIESRRARILDVEAWRGFDILCSRVLMSGNEKTWTRGLCKVVNKGLSMFNHQATVPMAKLIVIVPPGAWHAYPLAHTGGTIATQDCDSVMHMEVCSAPEFVAVLARSMLSEQVHDSVNIQCLRRGLYSYLQCTLAWFSGATGPFRSREVTVFTPEADCKEADTRWTHSLPDGLDTLKTCSTGYLVHCHEASLNSQESIVGTLLKKSSGVILVNSFGNLVLHSNHISLQLCTMRGEPGVHAVVDGCRGDRMVQNDSCQFETVYMRCEHSLREYCEMHGIPKGIRGPDTWQTHFPWSRTEPEGFCRGVAKLQYRWESGRMGFMANAIVEGSYLDSYTKRIKLDWVRCSDGKLIPKPQRFWHLIDYKQSMALWNKQRNSVSGQTQQIQVDSDTDSSSDMEDVGASKYFDDSDQEQLLKRGQIINVPSEWHDSGLAAVVRLNSRLCVQFLHSLPEKEGHVFFEPVHNMDFNSRMNICENGKVVKYYKCHKFSSLMHDITTVMMFGCGLRPVFVWGSTDTPGQRILILSLATLALADRLSPAAYPKHPRVVIIVRAGREGMLQVARALTSCILVTTATCASKYTFTDLPAYLEETIVPCSKSGGKEPVDQGYASPESFLNRSGLVMFTKLTQLWPSVTQRGDVKRPFCSRDPRWIGLMVCLAEWQGLQDVADLVAPGALEALTEA